MDKLYLVAHALKVSVYELLPESNFRGTDAGRGLSDDERRLLDAYADGGLGAVVVVAGTMLLESGRDEAQTSPAPYLLAAEKALLEANRAQSEYRERSALGRLASALLSSPEAAEVLRDALNRHERLERLKDLAGKREGVD